MMICRSKHGLAKIAVIESIPLVMGATFGGIGRLSGEHWIPAVPIVADFMTTAAVYDTPRGMWGLVNVLRNTFGLNNTTNITLPTIPTNINN